VGFSVGLFVGLLGKLVGGVDGLTVGALVGDTDGCAVGTIVGNIDG